MNDFPDPPARLASPGRSPGLTDAGQDGCEESKELKVPRSIVRWSKWRKAALRAEHRENRRTQQAAQARVANSSEFLTNNEKQTEDSVVK
jgi:hypothetical protein